MNWVVGVDQHADVGGLGGLVRLDELFCSRAVLKPFSTALVAEHSAPNFELNRVPTETFSPQMYYRNTQVLVLTRVPRPSGTGAA